MTKHDTANPQLSIIIPAYNEGRRLGPALEQIRRHFESSDTSAEVIVVDDGSSDDTAAVALAFEPGPLTLRLIRNRRNEGKGYSVRRGMRKATGAMMLMTDADQSTPIYELAKALPYLSDGYDVVIGSRDVAESVITKHQPGYRHGMGLIMRGLRRMLMLRDIKDTQCGFKLFSRRAAKAIFPRVRERGFAFDCEVLLVARQMGCRIKELGVLWCNDPDSRVRPVRDSLRMLVALARIHWRIRHVKHPQNR
jgi:dolichyl-phosphate beta-glucosyltransferase